MQRPLNLQYTVLGQRRVPHWQRDTVGTFFQVAHVALLIDGSAAGYSTLMVKQLWLLLLRSFMLVLATFLTAPPCSISIITSASLFTTSSHSLATNTGEATQQRRGGGGRGREDNHNPDSTHTCLCPSIVLMQAATVKVS